MIMVIVPDPHLAPHPWKVAQRLAAGRGQDAPRERRIEDHALQRQPIFQGCLAQLIQMLGNRHHIEIEVPRRPWASSSTS